MAGQTGDLMQVWIIALAIVAAGGLIALALGLRGRGAAQGDGVTRGIEQIAAAQAALAGRLSQVADAQAASHGRLNRTLEERLEAVSLRLGQSLSESAVKTAESLGELQQRLRIIDEAQKNITELSGQVVSLQDILANKQARGAFGEIQLHDLVANALPASAYAFQVVLSNNRRADCVIRLPHPPGPIVVDAKFPLEAYHQLCAAGDDGARQRAARAFADAMLKHVKDIAERYIIAGETAESALLFLASEAVYAELHARHPDVVQKSFRARVWIVSPTTMMATLNTIRAVLKDARMREQSHVILKEVGLLAGDIERLGKRVESLRGHFSQAERDIGDIETSAGRIGRRAERMETIQLDDEDDALPAPAARETDPALI
jgi:DNA recombination protein RmuC